MENQSKLFDIPVEAGEPLTGNVVPLLNELRHALEQLLLSGEERIIDLRSLPMAPGEENRIEKTLGQGEVSARITALGVSELIETGFPGIWRVTHRNNAGEVVSKFIEVTHCPSIMRSQEADMRVAVSDLKELVENQ